MCFSDRKLGGSLLGLHLECKLLLVYKALCRVALWGRLNPQQGHVWL